MTKDQLKIQAYDALANIQYWQEELKSINEKIQEIINQETPAKKDSKLEEAAINTEAVNQ